MDGMGAKSSCLFHEKKKEDSRERETKGERRGKKIQEKEKRRGKEEK